MPPSQIHRHDEWQEVRLVNLEIGEHRCDTQLLANLKSVAAIHDLPVPSRDRFAQSVSVDIVADLFRIGWSSLAGTGWRLYGSCIP
jgi:hypothetical protein